MKPASRSAASASPSGLTSPFSAGCWTNCASRRTSRCGKPRPTAPAGSTSRASRGAPRHWGCSCFRSRATGACAWSCTWICWINAAPRRSSSACSRRKTRSKRSWVPSSGKSWRARAPRASPPIMPGTSPRKTATPSCANGQPGRWSGSTIRWLSRRSGRSWKSEMRDEKRERREKNQKRERRKKVKPG